MIHVERQGHNECALATMAALESVPLYAVRELALDQARRTGRPFYTNTNLNAVADRIDPTGRLKSILGLPDGFWQALPPITGSGVRHLSKYIRALPARGRGAVTFRWNGKRMGHVAPWEAGLVYDPQAPELPMTLQEYRRRNPGVSVVNITITEEAN